MDSDADRKRQRSVHRILVVEDEFLIAMELELILIEAGFTVVGPVPTVDAALALIAIASPQAAILDVNLRGESVTPVILALRSRNVPFALATGYDAIELDRHDALSGITNLGKPVASASLVTEVQRMVDLAAA